MSASGSAFVNFDDILVDLKLTPAVLDIIAPRYHPALILQPFISLVSLIATIYQPGFVNARRYCVDSSAVAQRNQVGAGHVLHTKSYALN